MTGLSRWLIDSSRRHLHHDLQPDLRVALGIRYGLCEERRRGAGALSIRMALVMFRQINVSPVTNLNNGQGIVHEI